MHIVKFQGGIGNQMFQYALYTKLKTLGKEVKADIMHYNIDISKQGGTYRCFAIKNEFNIELNIATEEEIHALYALTNERMRKRIIKSVGKKTYYKENANSISNQQEFLNKKNVYLDGFWQSEKYFHTLKNEIRSIYSFPDCYIERAVFYNKDISENPYSVGLHMRFGDYLKDEYSKLYGGICTKEYYVEAIKRINCIIPQAVFYVFSDDIDIARSLLEGINADIVFIRDTNCISEACDMFLLSKCKHQIISNSTYGWWGAWLNSNPQKIVIAPKKWLNIEKKNDVVPDDWIKI